MGPPGNKGSWGPYVLAHTQTTPKKAHERYQGHLLGPPTDPGPSVSARVLKWSVRPWVVLQCKSPWGLKKKPSHLVLKLHTKPAHLPR
ncbi:unnamed protein product [Staurois parvus]|uniref:Uncharacterized protein n=1 Tax=Staurois parvus TaxID=386267 RepID=A0ABN9DY18_9NEOB|nr:unnamed protein product [Staurois parvus]